jgi:D-alanine-D-alanine ligase and related ATP-grasp enzymes
VLPAEWFTRSAYRADKNKVIKQVCSKIRISCICKTGPTFGSSIGVSRADDPESLEDSLELAFEYDRRVLVEKGLDKPIELNCSVAGYDDEVTASPIEMPINNDEFLDFRDKYLASGGSKGMASLRRVLPAPIEEELKEEIQEMSRNIFEAAGLQGRGQD